MSSSPRPAPELPRGFAGPRRGSLCIADGGEAAVANAVPALFYRTYGYSYSVTWLYDGDAIRARIADGRIDAFAVMRGERAVGFLDFRFSRGSDEVLETGVIVVDPYLDEIQRGHVVALLLQEAMARVTRHVHERGVRLIFSTETTDHTVTQRWLYRIGMVPTGLLFDTVPAGAHILSVPHAAGGPRQVAGPSRRRQRHRRSEVLSTYAVRPLIAPYVVARPPVFASLLAPIYQRLDLPVTFAPARPAEGASAHVCYTDIARGIVTIDVNRLGADCADHLIPVLDHFVLGHVPAVHVLLPLDQGDPGPAIDALCRYGCVFGGLMPRYKGSDRLVLQHARAFDPLLTEDHLTDEIPRAVLRAVRS